MIPPAASTIIVGHGSYLTCHRRLACTSTRHARLRRAYYNGLATDRRRAAGVGQAKRGRTHGTRSAYRHCTAGDDGGPCQKCKEAERVYKAAYRARAVS